MISAGAGVMGSDNSNGSAHKHLAQFTLSNAPHGPTLSSCLSVCLLTQLTVALQFIKYIDFFFFSPSCPNLCLTSFSDPALSITLLFLDPYADNKTVRASLIFSPYLTKTPLIHLSHFLPDTHTNSFHFLSLNLSLPHTASSFPSPSLSLYNDLSMISSFFFFLPGRCFTLLSLSLSPTVSLSLSIMSLPPPTEDCLNRWLVAGCCCALLVGLQEAAYLSVCVRVRVCS